LVEARRAALARGLVVHELKAQRDRERAGRAERAVLDPTASAIREQQVRVGRVEVRASRALADLEGGRRPRLIAGKEDRRTVEAPRVASKIGDLHKRALRSAVVG
jgi:hypothetical protein